MTRSERYQIEKIKQQYPPGTRLELKEMDDPHAPVPPGTRGTVALVDDVGSIHMNWDNGRTLAVISGVDQFRVLSEQEIQAEQEIQITTISAESLRSNRQQEGLILQGCGGDLREWVEGINEILTDHGILKEGSKFRTVQTFQNNGLTNLVFPFLEDVKLDWGKLPIWRVQTYDSLGGTWLSDYVENQLGGYVSDPAQQASRKPDCPLIGQDGNIFNLIGIASRTLRENGMSEEAKQMQKKITQCESYGAALNVIGQYVNITSVDEEDWYESMKITDVVSLSYSYTNQLLSKVARTGYDPNGNTISQTYNLTYDDFGQLTKVQVGTAWTLIANEYNSAGFLEKQTYGNGDYLEYTYDELGRVKETTTETGKTVTYAYTADGQLGSVDMGTTLSYDYLYDSLGRLITSSRHDSGELVLKTRHEYDTSNRLSKQHLNLVDKTYSESYTYDSYGRVSSMTSGNGTTITYTYDALSRLSTVTTPVYKITYTYTEGSTQVENISYSAVNSNRMEALSFSLEYDELGNIVSRDYDTLFGSLSIKYDEQGQVLSQIGTSKTYTHTYDTCGNRVSSQNKLGSHTYTYGNSDWKDLLTAFDGGSITYDASGNPTSYYNGTRWTFTWANGRELTKAVSSGHTITYSYDGDGLRLSKTVDGVVYNYVYASGKLIRETIGDDVVMDFFYDANGQPYAFSYNGLMLYYILNPQGDVQRIVNSAGTAYVSYSYDEWGYVTWCTDNDYGNNNPLRYRGYVYDTESGLYYLQSRYYDPAIGRFINADSLVSTGQGFLGYNMFAYCGNSPTNYSDPTGAKPSFWYTLFEDHDPGYIHRAVQAHILIVNNTDEERKYDSEYVMPGIGRADIVCLSTGEMWEIKHGGSTTECFDSRITEALGRLTTYVNKGCSLSKGSANRFSGSFVIAHENQKYLVSYSTPVAGAIIYTVASLPDNSRAADFVYAPYTLYNPQPTVDMAMAGGACALAYMMICADTAWTMRSSALLGG